MQNSISKKLYPLLGKLAPFFSRYIYWGIAIFGIIWYAIYTNFIIERLERYSNATTEVYAQLISEALFDKMDNVTEYIVLEQIIRDFDMPIIITDMYTRPRIWKNITVGHLFWKKRIAYDDNSFKTLLLLRKKMTSFKSQHKPKLIYGKDKQTKMGFLYYDNSSFISGIAYMPFFEALFIILLALIIYLVVKTILITEKGSLWVGLAKETAHQLGTPLTSLMGWIEYLKVESEASKDDDFGFSSDDGFPDKVMHITDDMAKDVSRLRKVTNRFSLIGSLPTLKKGRLDELLEDHISYFSKRLPTLGKKINIELSFEELPEIKMNYDLLSWVFENLFKNSLDAIDQTTGMITINAQYISVDNVIRVIHRDTGKGIKWENRHSVFNPGYTTKKRGWGLGLSLAKRIIEEYHQGRIYISMAQRGKGCEFTIDLPVIKKEKEK